MWGQTTAYSDAACRLAGFGGPELLARVRSALRRGVQASGTPATVRTGDVTIDLARRAVAKAGAEVKLSRKEFDLLAELAANLGKPVAHERLLGVLSGSPDADIRYLRVYVGQVRSKIEDDRSAQRCSWRPGLWLSIGLNYAPELHVAGPSPEPADPQLALQR
jgi:two-component system KDP operon response regulator KdpE